MEKIPNSLFHIETAGSLAPDLEGAPVSARHQNRATPTAKEHKHSEKKTGRQGAPAPLRQRKGVRP